jgi:hypothetical protein
MQYSLGRHYNYDAKKRHYIYVIHESQPAITLTHVLMIYRRDNKDPCVSLLYHQDLSSQRTEQFMKQAYLPTILF